MSLARCFCCSFKMSFQLHLALPVTLQRSRNAESSHLFFSFFLLCDRISAASRRQMARLLARSSSNSSSTVSGCWASSVVILSALWPSQTPSSIAAALSWPTHPAGGSTWPPLRSGAERASYRVPRSATSRSESTARSAWSRAASAGWEVGRATSPRRCWCLHRASASATTLSPPPLPPLLPDRRPLPLTSPPATRRNSVAPTRKAVPASTAPSASSPTAWMSSEASTGTPSTRRSRAAPSTPSAFARTAPAATLSTTPMRSQLLPPPLLPLTNRSRGLRCCVTVWASRASPQLRRLSSQWRSPSLRRFSSPAPPLSPLPHLPQAAPSSSPHSFQSQGHSSTTRTPSLASLTWQGTAPIWLCASVPCQIPLRVSPPKVQTSLTASPSSCQPP